MPSFDSPISSQIWAAIEPRLDQVLDLPIAQQDLWVRRLHSEDPRLADTLQRLLDASRLSSGILDTPISSLLPPLPSDASDPAIGPALGRYDLVRPLGRGGTATVYLGWDHKHQRSVALKVLHPDLAAVIGPERFLREIATAASLHHPHIVPLFDSGWKDGLLFYVMPYIEGETLRARLAAAGSLSGAEVRRIGIEVADALDYAHRRGLVHRDIKPENVLLQDGHALVADFGIATAIDEAGGVMSERGHGTGTPAYMSPEQILANDPIDGRSDIYSLGCVLYELLTGTPLFSGTIESVAHQHLSQTPIHLERKRRGLSHGLVHVIARALAKRPEARYATARAFADALIKGEGVSRRAIFAAGAAVAALLTTAGVYGVLRESATAPARGVVPEQSQVTFAGSVGSQAVSPDGRWLAYITLDNAPQLVVLELPKGVPRVLGTFDDAPRSIRWSPDNSAVLATSFDTAGHYLSSLFPINGGPTRPAPLRGGYAAFSPDGARYAAWRANYLGGNTDLLIKQLRTGAMTSFVVPRAFGWRGPGDWQPGGRLIVLATQSPDSTAYYLVALDTQTGRWKVVVSDSVWLSSPKWDPKHHGVLYYVRAATDLYRVAVASSGESVGVPELLETGLEAADLSITADGDRLFYTRAQDVWNLWDAVWRPGAHDYSRRQLTRGTLLHSSGTLSPDGRWIAFTQGQAATPDLVVIPANGGEIRYVARGVAWTWAPAWSPDSRSLAFLTSSRGRKVIATVTINNGQKHTFDRTAGTGLFTWAPSDRILFQVAGNRNLAWLDTARGVIDTLLPGDSTGWLLNPWLSPDSRTVAVYWNREPVDQTYLISLRDRAVRPIGPLHAHPIGWSADGRAVFMMRGIRIYRVAIHEEHTDTMDLPFPEGDCSATQRPGALHMLCVVGERHSDVWMIKGASLYRH